MKFAIRGTLEMNDKTDDDFYATKKIWTNFRRLREIMENECSPRRPIFLCNFNNQPPSQSIASILSVKSLKQSEVEIIEDLMVEGFETFNRRPFDANLPKYLQIVQEAMQVYCLISLFMILRSKCVSH